MRVPIQQPLPPSHIASEPPIEDSETVSLILATLLIPGRGEPIHNGVLAIKGGKIDWIGSYISIPPKYKGILLTHVSVLMPGLWDCHVHFVGLDVVGNLGGGTYLPGFNALVGAVTVEDLKMTLMAGYTSVRELGGYGGDLWPAVENGPLIGPNIYSAIAPLSITGGHADDHLVPINTVIDAMNCGGSPVGVCDGVDDCVKTVRKMIRRGARCIKVCSSGGVGSLNDDPEDRQFSDEELKAMVEEAARSRRAVAAHAIGKAGILAALRAGVKSIEHGMYMDDEVIDLMLEKDAIFVPTQHIVRILARDYGDLLPPPVKRKLFTIIDRSKDSYRLAIKRGVKIALGTDMTSSARSSALSHGNNAHELTYAVELGMTPLQAIECATANGPETLGGMAPLSGQLKVGYDADIIAVAKNPLDDVRVLTDPKNITHVWKGGKLFKNQSRIPAQMPF
ncbi:amidohydrolase [Trichoderma arundinaceum]|uniref:Amidohydrolase n=1 Tax=Trichoderma arundinaceum TaxID=490622 RepID=A0A395NGY0_TRIAR|nr:amidohydrolase [Trichoderma arundinaceum]